MTYIGDNPLSQSEIETLLCNLPIYPKLSSIQMERYKQIARETIQAHPYIRYGQAIVNAIKADQYTVIYPELFYCKDESKVEQLLKVMEE